MPPLASPSVPEMFERVEVATHEGTPETSAKVKPFVPEEVVARRPASFPRRTVFAWTLAHPVPPR